MTPFKKAFPGADENTVFEVVKSFSGAGYCIGDVATLHEDTGTQWPIFKIGKRGFLNAPIKLSDIRIKEPQLKKGDRCLVSSNGKDWKERKYYCDISDSGSSRPNLCFRSIGGGVMGWKYAKPLPQTQTVTLQDGTELTIPNDAAEKLREEYA